MDYFKICARKDNQKATYFIGIQASQASQAGDYEVILITDPSQVTEFTDVSDTGQVCLLYESAVSAYLTSVGLELCSSTSLMPFPNVEVVIKEPNLNMSHAKVAKHKPTFFNQLANQGARGWDCAARNPGDVAFLAGVALLAVGLTLIFATGDVPLVTAGLIISLFSFIPMSGKAFCPEGRSCGVN
ncbi:MAG: hypothetical protein Q8R24_01575 [Legionellaceae bacterium]|nr:hypothetical protein [Legionellaceae bacterium]